MHFGNIAICFTSYCLCFFRDWYESHSMLLCDEGAVFAGLLVGLNVIDCNFDLKGHDLDTQVFICFIM